MKMIAVPTDRRFKDLTNKTFGRWTVLAYAGRRKANHQWSCSCKCGINRTVLGQHLKSGRSTSCGCSQQEVLTGATFGRLTVIRLAEIRRYPGRTCLMWFCLCECGNETTVIADSLRRGNTTSCGCYCKEQQRKAVTIHGQSHTHKYRAMLARRRAETGRDLDAGWCWSMEEALHEEQPACVLCGTEKNLTVDHVKPLSRGHGLYPGNAVVLCRSCNSTKSNKHPDDLPADIRIKLLKAAADFAIYWKG